MSCRLPSVLIVLALAAAAAARAAEPASTNRLPEVVVTSTRLPELVRPIEEHPANVTVVPAAAIEQSPAFTTMEILRQQTGIAMADTVGFSQSGTKVTMRGYSDKPGTLILVDGVRVSDAGDNSFLWNSIPVENIERIEVIRGGASTIYGEGAVAGVINIVTKTGAAKPFTATLTGAGGNLGFSSGHAAVAGRVGKFDYTLSLDRKEWDGWREASAFRSWSVHAKPSFTTAIGRFTLGYDYHWSESEDPGNLTAAQYATDPRQAGSNQVVFENEIHRAHLAYEKTFATGWTLAGRVFGQTYDSESLSTAYAYRSEIEQPNYGGTLQLSCDAPVLQRDNLFVIGTELIQQDFENRGNGLVSTIADHWTASAFVQDTFRIVPQLALEVGTRFDHREWDILLPFAFPVFDDRREASVWSPKAALTWNPVEKTAVWLSLSRSFRLPGGLEISSAAYEPGYFILGNPQIEPVDARTIEVGARCDRSHWLTGSLTYYYSDVKDDIVFNPFVPPYGQNQNFDSIRQGVELELHSSPVPWLDLYFNTAFVHAEFDGGAYDGNRLPHVPLWQLNGGATVRPLRGLALTLEATHVRDQVVLNDLLNALPQNEYTVLNAKGSYQYKLATFFASVNNLLDRKYELFPAFSTFAGRRYYPAPGINFQLGATLTF